MLPLQIPDIQVVPATWWTYKHSFSLFLKFIVVFVITVTAKLNGIYGVLLTT